MKITIKSNDYGIGIYTEDGSPFRFFQYGDDLIRLLSELSKLPVTDVEVTRFINEEEYERDFV